MNSDAKKELGVGIFFLALSIAYMIGAAGISTFTPFGNRGLDSRSVPLLLGFLMLILSAVHIVLLLLKERKLTARKGAKQSGIQEEVLRGPDEAAYAAPPGSNIITRIDSVVPLKLILSMALLVIYVAAYQKAGFIISSTFFLMAESFLLVKEEERKKWSLFIILYSVAASVLIYFIFTKYLSLFLPRGILG